MHHFLRITREEWQEIYRIARTKFGSPAWTWARALINTELGAVEDDGANLRLSGYEAEQIVESFASFEDHGTHFPGLEHGSLSSKLYTLWDNVQHDIDLDRTHGCT